MWTCFHSCASLKASVWLLTRPITCAFCLSLVHFFSTLHTCLGLPHLMVAHLLECQYGHTIDNLSTHLLWCLCGNEHIIAHDTFQDTLVAITWGNGAHVQKEVSHLFPHHTWQQVDILIFRNDFQTLMDVIIANQIHIDMVQQTSTTTAHVAMMVVQEKTWSYAEQTLRNDFNPLAIEMYECYHYCFNSLLTNCAQTTITCYQRSSLAPLILISYYWQHVPITL